MKQAFNRITEITNIDGKSLVERALKTSEEAGELAGATLSYVKAPGTSYKNLGKDDVIEEAVDTLICAFSMIAHASPEMTLEDISSIVNKKMDKWEEKVSQCNIKNKKIQPENLSQRITNRFRLMIGLDRECQSCHTIVDRKDCRDRTYGDEIVREFWVWDCPKCKSINNLG